MNTELIEELEKKLASDQAELAANMEAIRRVKKLLASSNTNNDSQYTGSTTGTPTEKPQADRLPLGNVDQAVKDIVASLDLDVFSSKHIEEKLVAQGKKMNRSSISAAIGRMRDKGLIAVVSQGQGRRPTQYKSL